MGLGAKNLTKSETAPPQVMAWIGLGANLGNPLLTLQSAVKALSQVPQSVLQACSSFYRSAPFEAQGPDFFNAVVLLRTTLQALELLHHLQAVEVAHLRERSYLNAPRTLDLDLLLWGDQPLALPELQVPHPRMHLRAFVLLPLAEISPEVMIPGRGPVGKLLPAVAGQRIHKLTEIGPHGQ